MSDGDCAHSDMRLVETRTDGAEVYVCFACGTKDVREPDE